MLGCARDFGGRLLRNQLINFSSIVEPIILQDSHIEGNNINETHILAPQE